MIEEAFEHEGTRSRFHFNGEGSVSISSKTIIVCYDITLRNSGLIGINLKVGRNDYDELEKYLEIQDELQINASQEKLSITLYFPTIAFVDEVNEPLCLTMTVSEVKLIYTDRYRELGSLDQLYIHYGISNMFSIIPHVSNEIVFSRNNKPIVKWDANIRLVDSPVGQFRLNHYSDINQREKSMINSKTSLITSEICFSINGINLDEFDKITMPYECTVTDFLTISSFIQTSRHTWNFIVVEKNDNPIIIKMRTAPNTFPNFLPLNNGLSDAMYFVLYPKFRSNSLKSNIALAIDWYLESTSSDRLESKYLHLFTMLECIITPYHRNRNTEFILTELEYENLEGAMLPKTRQILEDLGKDKDKDKELFNTLQWAFLSFKNRTLSSKFKEMLSNLNLNSDLSIRKIIDIRNDIIHRGDIDDGATEYDLYYEYRTFWSIMIQIILKILEYPGEYFDINLKRRMNLQ